MRMTFAINYPNAKKLTKIFSCGKKIDIYMYIKCVVKSGWKLCRFCCKERKPIYLNFFCVWVGRWFGVEFAACGYCHSRGSKVLKAFSNCYYWCDSRMDHQKFLVKNLSILLFFSLYAWNGIAESVQTKQLHPLKLVGSSLACASWLFAFGLFHLVTHKENWLPQLSNSI